MADGGAGAGTGPGPQDSYMNENFEDSYEQYDNYKDKPKGDSFMTKVQSNQVSKPGLPKTQNLMDQMEFSVEANQSVLKSCQNTNSQPGS